MVKSPAALVPCCKTIPLLWEAVEFPLSMVQMTPACKPLTEMSLDSVPAAGEGGGMGARGGHFWLLFQFRLCAALLIHHRKALSFGTGSFASLTQLPAWGCVSWLQSASAKAHCCLQDPCVWNQVNLTVCASPSVFLKGLSSLASFHTGHLVFYLQATHLLFFPAGLLGLCKCS